MRALLLLTLLLTGCATQPAPIAAKQLVGRYANGDPFWPRWLELNDDGSFFYLQMTDTLNEKGEFEGSWGLDGTWAFHGPDRIELTPKSGPRQVVVFVRISKRDGYAILEPDLFSDILVTWEENGGLRYLKKESGQPPELRETKQPDGA